jgi:hypothetical protein
MEENNIKPRQLEALKSQGKMTEIHFSQYILQAASLFIHYQFLIYYGKDLFESLVFTWLLFIGFIIPTLFYSYVIDINPSLKLFWINGGYNFFAMTLFSVFIFMFEEIRGE